MIIYLISSQSLKKKLRRTKKLWISESGTITPNYEITSSPLSCLLTLVSLLNLWQIYSRATISRIFQLGTKSSLFLDQWLSLKIQPRSRRPMTLSKRWKPREKTEKRQNCCNPKKKLFEWRNGISQSSSGMRTGRCCKGRKFVKDSNLWGIWITLKIL